MVVCSWVAVMEFSIEACSLYLGAVVLLGSTVLVVLVWGLEV